MSDSRDGIRIPYLLTALVFLAYYSSIIVMISGALVVAVFIASLLMLTIDRERIAVIETRWLGYQIQVAAQAFMLWDQGRPLLMSLRIASALIYAGAVLAAVRAQRGGRGYD